VPSERQFLAAAAVVAVVSAGVVAVAPGVLADPTDDPVRPGPVNLVDLAIAENGLTGETATLAVENRLQHRGPPAPNVTVTVRAVDTDSGLLTTERTVDVGTLTGDREVVSRTNLTVPREGGYRIETTVYVDGQRVETGSRTIQGLSALTPPRARSTVAFADAGAVPPLSVSIAEAGGNETTLAITSSLVNGGDEAVGDLAVRVVVRQAESNVVAADRTIEVGRIRPGRTDGATAEVTVPANYNYRVDGVLLRDGVRLDTAQTVVNLDPRRTIEVDTTEEEVRFEAGEFERGGTGPQRDRPRATGTPVAAGGPGFGPVVPVVAALALAALAAARSRVGGEDR
jgi:hypothetical protein